MLRPARQARERAVHHQPASQPFAHFAPPRPAQHASPSPPLPSRKLRDNLVKRGAALRVLCPTGLHAPAQQEECMWGPHCCRRERCLRRAWHAQCVAASEGAEMPKGPAQGASLCSSMGRGLHLHERNVVIQALKAAAACGHLLRCWDGRPQPLDDLGRELQAKAGSRAPCQWKLGFQVTNASPPQPWLSHTVLRKLVGWRLQGHCC